MLIHLQSFCMNLLYNIGSFIIICYLFIQISFDTMFILTVAFNAFNYPVIEFAMNSSLYWILRQYIDWSKSQLSINYICVRFIPGRLLAFHSDAFRHGMFSIIITVRILSCIWICKHPRAERTCGYFERQLRTHQFRIYRWSPMRTAFDPNSIYIYVLPMKRAYLSTMIINRDCFVKHDVQRARILDD